MSYVGETIPILDCRSRFLKFHVGRIVIRLLHSIEVAFESLRACYVRCGQNGGLLRGSLNHFAMSWRFWIRFSDSTFRVVLSVGLSRPRYDRNLE